MHVLMFKTSDLVWVPRGKTKKIWSIFSMLMCFWIKATCIMLTLDLSFSYTCIMVGHTGKKKKKEKARKKKH